MFIKTITLATLLLAVQFASHACTTILIGKDATADGSVIVTHSDDNELQDERLVLVPAADHKPGSKRPVYYDGCSLGWEKKYGGTYSKRYVGTARGPVYDEKDYPKSIPLGYIPQVPHTYAYLEGNYGIMNEHQLSIGECTCNAKVQPKPAKNKRLFYSAELSRVALERCKTAREAIKLMGSLIEKYGYYGTGETLLVGDTKEGWVFEMCGYEEDGDSGLWAAQRVPDDKLFVAANEFRIRDLKPDDPNVMFSEKLFDVAKAKGWWKPEDGPLDWLKTVSDGEYNHPYYSLRRVWRVMSKANPDAKLSPYVKDGFTRAYPFSIKPKKKLSVADAIALHRDHYEGTEFDLTKGIAAGPFGSPNRYTSSQDSNPLAVSGKKLPGAWERPLSVFYCGYVYVNQSRSSLPDPIGGVCWFGNGTPAETCLVPFYAGITHTPVSFSSVDTSKFDLDAAWWIFNFVDNFSSEKYDYMTKDIDALQQKIEAEQYKLIPAMDQAALHLHKSGSIDLCRKFLTDFCTSNANDVVKRWKDLAATLIVKYNSGFVNTPGKMGQVVGYPQWWLDKVGYKDGPTTYEKKK